MDRPTTPSPQRVGIIGAGRIARVLARALIAAGHTVVAASARTDASRRAAASLLEPIPVVASPADVITDAEIVLLCIPDDAVEQVARSLAEHLLDDPDARARPRTYVTVSGSVSLSALDALADIDDADVGRLHPLQTVTLDTQPDALAGVPAAVTASSPRARATLHALAADLGMSPFDLADADRGRWHAAATLAANAPIALLAHARDLAVSAGLDANTALTALGRLATTAINNAVRDTPEQALTGPVVRGDLGTIDTHLAALREHDPQLVALYAELARSIGQVAAGAGRIDADQQHALASLLDRVPSNTLHTVRTPAELHERLAAERGAGRRVGFVPTMGALHAGHLELMRTARAECDVVVVSCYVNPLQFGAGEDLERYPRTPDADARVVASAGVDVLWLPTDADVHEAFAGEVAPITVGGIGERYEGASRPGHFDGVATVVARLLAAVRPDVVYLGEKDAQQVAVVRRLLRRLAIEVALRVVPTVREADGVALSSRNSYLTVEQRAAARAIPRALDAGREAAAAGAGDGADGVDARVVRDAVRAVLAAEPLVEVDYVDVVDTETFVPVVRVHDEDALLIVAVRIGTTRLIDNVRVMTWSD